MESISGTLHVLRKEKHGCISVLMTASCSPSSMFQLVYAQSDGLHVVSEVILSKPASTTFSTSSKSMESEMSWLFCPCIFQPMVLLQRDSPYPLLFASPKSCRRRPQWNESGQKFVPDRLKVLGMSVREKPHGSRLCSIRRRSPPEHHGPWEAENKSTRSWQVTPTPKEEWKWVT